MSNKNDKTANIPSFARAWEGNGHYYGFFKKEKNWHEAFNHVRQKKKGGGFLATIESASENHFVYEHSNEGGSIHPNIAWIGATRQPHSNGWNSWIWSAVAHQSHFHDTGFGQFNPVNGAYNNFWPGEPNHSGNAVVTGFLRVGAWDDRPSHWEHNFIGEWGRKGPEYFVWLEHLGGLNNKNGTEGQSSASIRLHLDRPVRDDYVRLNTNHALIDIPITFSGTAKKGTDYTLSVSGGRSYFKEGKLHVIGTNNADNAHYVDLNFTPRDNNTWNPLRSITITLGPDELSTDPGLPESERRIYGLGKNGNNKNISRTVWLQDDEPQLSLGQGAWQFIRTPFTGDTLQVTFDPQQDILLIDENGIDENDKSYADLGLTDNFAVRWETYIRIPKTGTYTFRTDADDKAFITLHRNNAEGEQFTNGTRINKGDVLWIRMDHIERVGFARARLLWTQPGKAEELVPTSQMFLSETLAKRGSIQEPEKSDSRQTGFELFANRSIPNDEKLNIQLKSSSQQTPTTAAADSPIAQRQSGPSSRVGDDFRLEFDSATIFSTETNSIGSNDFQTWKWTPNQPAFSLKNQQQFKLAVLPDAYAEASENIKLTLKEHPGYGVINDGTDKSKSSQTISIEDNPYRLSIKEINQPQEGEVGWITISTGGRPTPKNGLKVAYSVNNGTATLGEDILTPKATLTTGKSFKPEFLLDLPANSTEGRLYLSALADAIDEGEESLNIELKKHVRKDNQGFRFQNYLLEEKSKAATIKIKDGESFKAGIAITPKGRTGNAIIRAIRGDNGAEQAEIQVHLTSQPRQAVNIELTASSGDLSASTLVFSPKQWQTPQTVVLSNINRQQASVLTTRARSGDTKYANAEEVEQTIVPAGWSNDHHLTLKEGGIKQQQRPLVSILAVHGKEQRKEAFGFRVELDRPLLKDLEVHYGLETNKHVVLSGNPKDVSGAPESNNNGTYSVVIPAGERSKFIPLIPIDDQIAEGTEKIIANLISADEYSFSGQSGSATARLQDDDQAGFVYHVPTDNDIDTETGWTITTKARVNESADGGKTQLGIALTSQPRHNVTLTLDQGSYSQDDLTITNPQHPKRKASYTFTPKNWFEPQPLELQAVEEDIDDGDQAILINFKPSSDDSAYAALTPSISVRVIDNDATKDESNLVKTEAPKAGRLLKLSSGKQITLQEKSNQSQTFTISADTPSERDQIVYFGFDPSATTGDQETIRIKPVQPQAIAMGLNRRDTNAKGQTTTSIDSKAIDTGADGFKAAKQTGDFTTTWTGFLRIPETGHFTFTTGVTGGVQLSIDDQLIIDETADNKTEWTSLPIHLQAGQYVPIRLDYRSYATPDPQISLKWRTPSGEGNTPIGGDHWSRIGAAHLILPAGATSSSFHVQALNDEAVYNDQTFGFQLVETPGVNVRVVDHQPGESADVLTLELADDDRDSFTIPAGTILAFGPESDAKNTQAQASFSFAAEATIYRHHTTEIEGQVQWPSTQSDPKPSLKGMLGSDTSSIYRTLDPRVTIELEGDLEADQANPGEYSTAMKLMPTGHERADLEAGTELRFVDAAITVQLRLKSAPRLDEQGLHRLDLKRKDEHKTTIVLPAGTVLTLSDQNGGTHELVLGQHLSLEPGESVNDVVVAVANTDLKQIVAGQVANTTQQQSVTLTLSDDVSLIPGQTVSGIRVKASKRKGDIDLKKVEARLTTSHTLNNNNSVAIIDDDQAGLHFSIDAKGDTRVKAKSFIALKENGSAQSRYVQLTSQPHETVSLHLETSDASEAVLQRTDITPAPPAGKGISLTFTPETWNQPQEFKVIPVDDDIHDGTSEIGVYALTRSNDINYQELGRNTIEKPRKLSIQVSDDDQPGLRVEQAQQHIEEASNGFLHFALNSQPKADVELTLKPSDQQFTINNWGTGQSERIIFDPENWQSLQSIELRAVDDDAVEDITQSKLLLELKSIDADFDRLKVKPVSIDIVDNDQPTATLETISDSTENEKPGRFRIALSSPAPRSAGSKGVVVNYTISDVKVSQSLGHPSGLKSIERITQSPGAVHGKVRIAPGKRHSDVLVVPIDDFAEDKDQDKNFTVSLKQGSGYSINPKDPSNSATVHIIDNDEAGMMIFLSGDTLRTSEGDKAGEFNIGLLSQPSANVTITLTEEKLNGIQQLGKKAGHNFQRKLTFTPDNWFTPQRVNIPAFDDFTIEDESQNGNLVTYGKDGRPRGGTPLHTGIHPARLRYDFKSKDTSYNSRSQGNGHFTKTRQDVDVVDHMLSGKTANTLQNALTNFQEGIDSLALPIVGSLEGKTGGGIRKFIVNLGNQIRGVNTPTPARLGQIITDEINDAIGKDIADVHLRMDGTEAVEVDFSFADDYDVPNIPLDAKFGIPGLGLQSRGHIDADFAYEANLAFRFPRDGEPLLVTKPDQSSVDVSFRSELSDDFKLSGGLGLMQLEAVDQPSSNPEVTIDDEAASTGIDVNFELDLSNKKGVGADGDLTVSELIAADTKLVDLFNYHIKGDAALSLGVKTSVNGSEAVPSFEFDLSSLLPLFDYSNTKETEKEENQTDIFFDNIQLDLGSYITKMLNPVMDGIDDILTPIYPIIDALYADTQVFNNLGLTSVFDNDRDGKVSSIDLAEWFADLNAIIDPIRGRKLRKTIDATVDFIGTIKGVLDLIDDLNAMREQGNFYVDYGSYTLSDFRVGDDEEETPIVTADSSTTKDLRKDTGAQADAGGNTKAATTSKAGTNDGEPEASSANFASIMEQLDELGFEIPLIDDPSNAINLLLGNNVDLFKWRMPETGMSSEIQRRFPIFSGIEGIIEGGFGVDTSLGFGFDTTGLESWKNSGFSVSDSWKPFNGFYVDDRDADGRDVPEFKLSSTMGAGLGVSAGVVRSNITGGLEAAAGLDLLDVGEVSGTDDGRIYGDEIVNRISNPLNLFEMVGSLGAFLQARVQIGIDMGLFSTWKTVWRDRLAEIPIFEFSLSGSQASGTASNGYLKGSTVFFDANNDGRINSIEPYTVVGDDAHFDLHIDHRSFDRNGNGSIDDNEGRLVAIGGIDSSTNIPLSIPLLGAPGGMITPLTTVHSLGLDLGYKSKEIKQKLSNIFKLGDFDYLTEDPVLAFKSRKPFNLNTNANALAAYNAHTKLMTSLSVIHQAQAHTSNSQRQPLAVLKAFAEGIFEDEQNDINRNKLIRKALKNIPEKLTKKRNSEEAKLLKLAAKFSTSINAMVDQELKDQIKIFDANATPLNRVLNKMDALKSRVVDRALNGATTVGDGLYRFDTKQTKLKELNDRFDNITEGGLTKPAASQRIKSHQTDIDSLAFATLKDSEPSTQDSIDKSWLSLVTDQVDPVI